MARRLRALSFSGEGLTVPKFAKWTPLLLLSFSFAFGQRGAPAAPNPSDYSFAAGVEFLSQASSSWRKQHKCVTCHTNGWALAAQPLIAPESAEVAIGRKFAQQYLVSYLTGEAKPRRQHGSVEGLVATTAFLALSDARTATEVNPVTRRGLDHAWAILDESGTWNKWLQCNWPPFECDIEYGPTLMLVALGELRKIAEITAADQRGARKLIAFLTANDPVSLHAKAMRLWVASHWPKAVTQRQQKFWRSELLAARDQEGGWSMASLAGPEWLRDSGEPQVTTSEAYPTAFSIYVLLKTGMKPTHDVARSSLQWLRENQREDGSWHTRSPRRDRKHYISRAATVFALMALSE